VAARLNRDAALRDAREKMILVRNDLYQLRADRYRFLMDHAELRYMQNVKGWKDGKDDHLLLKNEQKWEELLKREDHLIQAKRVATNNEEFQGVKGQMDAQIAEAVSARDKAKADGLHFAEQAKRLDAEVKEVVAKMQSEIDAEKQKVNVSFTKAMDETKQLTALNTQTALEKMRADSAETSALQKKGAKHWNSSNVVKENENQAIEQNSTAVVQNAEQLSEEADKIAEQSAESAAKREEERAKFDSEMAAMEAEHSAAEQEAVANSQAKVDQQAEDGADGADPADDDATANEGDDDNAGDDDADAADE